jgi:hypothetical protein
MDKVMPGVENARVDEGVLVNAQRSLPPVRGRDDAQHVTALSCRETLLLTSTIEPDLRGSQGELENLRPVGPRSIRLLVTDTVASGHALELARVNHSRIPSRVLLRKRSPEEVSNHFCFITRMKLGAFPWSEPHFIEKSQDSKAIGEWAWMVLRKERMPDILLATLHVTTLPVPA